MYNGLRHIQTMKAQTILPNWGAVVSSSKIIATVDFLTLEAVSNIIVAGTLSFIYLLNY